MSKAIAGRGRELDLLGQWFADRDRAVVLVRGRAGHGKTTLVDAALSALPPATLVGRGQCSAGLDEPFMPWLEVLGRWCRGPEADALLRAVEAAAPSWAEHLLGGQVRAGETGPLPRELGQLLEDLASDRRVVVVLEDLHWADPSTLGVVEYLARRSGPGALVVGTWRTDPDQANVWRSSSVSAELEVEALDDAGIRELCQQRLGGPISPQLGKLLLNSSGGSPLLCANMLDDLRARGAVRSCDGIWSIAEGAGFRTPTSFRETVESRVGTLSAEQQQALVWTAIAGDPVCAQQLALLGEVEVTQAEHHADSLVQAGLLENDGVEVWPDGSVGGRYRLPHDLYRQVLRERISPSDEVRAHRRLAAAQLEAWGDESVRVAAELSLHFELGKQPLEAAQQRVSAAATALGRHGHAEAETHARRGLELLESAAASKARTVAEIELSLHLALALQGTRGYGSPEIQALFSRALRLAEKLDDRARVTQALRGLAEATEMLGNLRDASALTERLLSEQHPPALEAQLRHVRGEIHFFRGEFEQARQELLRSVALAGTSDDLVQLYTTHVTACGALITLAIVEHCLGRPGVGQERQREALQLARELSQPFTLAYVLTFAAIVDQLRGDLESCAKHAAEAVELADQYDLPHWMGLGAVLAGWAAARQSGDATAVEAVAGALAQHSADVMLVGSCYLLVVLAEAQAAADLNDAAAGTLAVAESLLERGERSGAVRLFLLQAELHRRGGRSNAAREALELAQAEARRQGAKTLELEVATALCSMGLESHEQVLELYRGFTRADECESLVRARAVLDDAPALQAPQEAEPLLGATTRAPVPEPSTPSARAGDTFQQQGEVWELCFDGKPARVAHLRGLGYLAELLRRPDEPVHALQLATSGPSAKASVREALHDGQLQVSNGGSDPLIDAQAREAYRSRVRDLRADLAEAEEHHDLGRAQRLQAELDMLLDELKRTSALGGRARTSPSATERARVNVTRAIKLALRRIASQHPELAKHLEHAVRTGTHCSYSPEVPREWEL